ncbi:hypothetical protein HYV12_04455 [Candidatus Dojkabacteria bacterium]|nr:hypothetical protein [Candidatus Dojkabacteria bacterium]
MKLNALPVLILLLIVCVAWIGLGIYFESSELDIDPNATSYMQGINPTFDTKGLTEMKEKVQENLPVSPDEFLSIIGKATLETQN